MKPISFTWFLLSSSLTGRSFHELKSSLVIFSPFSITGGLSPLIKESAEMPAAAWICNARSRSSVLLDIFRVMLLSFE